VCGKCWWGKVQISISMSFVTYTGTLVIMAKTKYGVPINFSLCSRTPKCLISSAGRFTHQTRHVLEILNLEKLKSLKWNWKPYRVVWHSTMHTKFPFSIILFFNLISCLRCNYQVIKRREVNDVFNFICLCDIEVKFRMLSQKSFASKKREMYTSDQWRRTSRRRASTN